jgi:2-polyprenyl-3-methyl-5-hydroxy-6-metoxy-1,4-benzoquinol methylase
VRTLASRFLPQRRNGALRPIPTNLPEEELRAELGRYADWFYEFEFANGAATRVPEDAVREIHDTRAKLVFPHLDRAFGRRWRRVECLDMACNQGWFAIQTALRGARVRGVDVRAEHVERAAFVSRLAGLADVRFEQANLYDLRPEREGTYDLTLFLGVLYHLENPVGALKVARSMTRELCVIETQVARPAPDLTYAWGSHPEPRSGHAMAVGRVDEHHVAEGEAVVLLPTLAALYDLLRAAGFKDVELAEPASNAHPQFVARDRVVMFARV